jgi:hypothetical protein
VCVEVLKSAIAGNQHPRGRQAVEDASPAECVAIPPMLVFLAFLMVSVIVQRLRLVLCFCCRSLSDTCLVPAISLALQIHLGSRLLRLALAGIALGRKRAGDLRRKESARFEISAKQCTRPAGSRACSSGGLD